MVEYQIEFSLAFPYEGVESNFFTKLHKKTGSVVDFSHTPG